ncbi:MAG: sodium/solute symporter [Eubacterium sp.]|nr:sodium/solute symporter [Eubacterium sp.]
MAIKIALLVVFFAVMLGIGVYSRSKAKNVNDYVLGGRTVGPWISAFAFGTSYFSSVVFIGYAGQFGWKFGLASTWIGLGNAFIGSLLAWLVLGRRTRLMTQKLDAKTMPEYFGKRFDSKSLRIVGSIIAFIFLVPYTAGVYNGLSRLFGMAFDIDYRICVIVMALLTGAYVVIGGYMATALNDFVQGIIMLIGICVVIGAVLSGQGGFLNAVKELSQIEPDIANTAPALQGSQGLLASFFGPDPMSLLGVVILTSLGTWGLPQMVHKFYAIKDEKSIKTGTVVSTFFAIIIAGGCYFLGGFGRLFAGYEGIVETVDGVQTVHVDNIVPTMLSTLPDILIGIVVVLVFSASMSTLSSLVLTSSSTLTLDLIKPIFKKDMKEKTQLRLMQVLVMCFIILSVVIAFNPPMFIAQLMGVSWGALAGAFLAPFMYGLYSKKITKASVWASYIFGVGFTVLNIFHPIIASPINAGAATMIGGLILVPIVSAITPKPDQDKVGEIFECYEKTVTVPEKENLGSID